MREKNSKLYFPTREKRLSCFEEERFKFLEGERDYVPPRNKFFECLTRNHKG
jgi:hypothetical protein